MNGYISPADEDSYARTIMDIMADSEGYARVSEAAQKELYINWDDVVREVYDDYNKIHPRTIADRLSGQR